METTYNVIFTGQLKDDSDQEEVIRKMAEITRSSEEKIRPIFTPGKPVIIKKGLSREAAEKYVRVLAGIGMQMKVSKSQPKQPGAAAAVQPPRTAVKPPPGESQEPHGPGPRPSGRDPNPYAAPKADLAVERKEETAFLETPLKVSAGNGWKWIWGGLKLFFSDFWKWLAMALVFFVIMIPVSLVPFIGNIINTSEAQMPGSTTNVRIVDEISPPTIGAPMRFITCDPVAVPYMTGINPISVVATVISLGLTRSAAPSMIAVPTTTVNPMSSRTGRNATSTDSQGPSPPLASISTR